MADEKSSDPTPGSDPASPHEPEQVEAADAVHPEQAEGGATSGDETVPDAAGDRAATDEAHDDDSVDEDPVDVAGATAPAGDPGVTAAHALRSDEPTDEEPSDDELSGGDEPTEPELAGVGASRRPVRRDRAEAAAETGSEPARKGRATRRRAEAEADAAPGRTSPVTFVNESVGELRKVVWPTAEQMRTYFVVVLVFVVFMIAVTSLLDLLFGWALLQVFR